MKILQEYRLPAFADKIPVRRKTGNNLFRFAAFFVSKGQILYTLYQWLRDFFRACVRRVAQNTLRRKFEFIRDVKFKSTC